MKSLPETMLNGAFGEKEVIEEMGALVVTETASWSKD